MNNHVFLKRKKQILIEYDLFQISYPIKEDVLIIILMK